MTTGQRIAEKRRELSISQETLGEALGVSRQSVYKWESGSALPEIDKLIALSRIFGVTVGWLLGEEDPAQGAPPAEELTEPQLALVEEIVRRYLAARRPEEGRRRLIGAALALPALGLLVFFAVQLHGLRNQCLDLQYGFYQITQSVNSQITDVTGRVEALLENQNNLTASHETELLSASLAANTAAFSVRAAPKTYVDGMTAVFLADDGTETVEVPGEPGENRDFSARLTCGLTDSIRIYVSFLTGDTRETQLLEEYGGLYRGSLPSVHWMDRSWLYKRAVHAEGTLSWSGEQAFAYTDSGCTTSSSSARLAGKTEGAARLEGVRYGLFQNQKLLGWLEPCEKPKEFRGQDAPDQKFYRFPDVSVVPEEGDLFVLATVGTDQYGRDFIVYDWPVIWKEGQLSDLPANEIVIHAGSADGWEY